MIKIDMIINIESNFREISAIRAVSEQFQSNFRNELDK